MRKKQPGIRLAYVFTPDEQADDALLDVLLLSETGFDIDLLIEERVWVDGESPLGRDHVNKFPLSTYTPSVRGIPVQVHTTFSLYIKDHWEILAGGIWQVHWTERGGHYLYELCSSGIELVQIRQLPLTVEQERVELAKKRAYAILDARSRQIRKDREWARREITYKKIDVIHCEEVDKEQFGERLGLGEPEIFPERTWIITLLCTPDKGGPAKEEYVLVGYYPNFFPYGSFRLTKTNEGFSVGHVYH